MRRLIFFLVFLLAGCLQAKLGELPKGEIIFKGSHRLQVEIAADKNAQAQGLMFRKNLAENEGMLFDFDSEGVYRFWMKNTYVPLSIAFLDRQGTVLQIEDMVPLDTVNYHISPPNTIYAVEAPQGWFGKRGIRAGDRATLPEK